jgi:hypothetical protein
MSKLYTRAQIQPDSINVEKRTVDVVFSTGATVRRVPWFSEPFNEELSMDPKHVRMFRLKNGAPLLDAHDLWRGSKSAIGVVESASIDGKQGKATIRFSRREEADVIFKEVQDGILRNISVGYNVHKFKDITKEGETPRRLRAIDWEPHEISVVPIGADPGAQVREEKESLYPVAIIGGNRNMADKEKTQGTTPEPAKNPETTPPKEKNREIDVEKLTNDATEAERKRVAEITRLTRKHGISQDFSDKMITDGLTLDQARAKILDEWTKQDDDPATKNNTPAEVADTSKARREAVTNALLHRYNPGVYKLSDHGRQYRGLTLLEIGREFVGVEKARGMGKMELARGVFHTTSDFPEVLANVVNKTLRDAYNESPQTFEFMVRRVPVSDFKQVSRTQLGEAPKLELVDEHGEYKRGTVGEAAEKYSLATYGKIVAITRQVIINDDLDAFTRLPAMFGRQAANLESDLVWGVITDNADMADGTALFHADHGNLAGAGAAISVTSLGEGRAAMRTQTGVDGETKLNIFPVWLAVPAALETDAERFILQIVETMTDEVNPFKGKLKVAAEPRLDDDSAARWYLFASTSQLDMIELGTLDGERGPQIETRDGFDIDGMEVKARMDLAAKAIDWRGMWRNDGP